jgi:hypothetical protein
MPSVYDYRHVELDKIGKGKRVLQAPGGNSSNIFGVTNGSNGVTKIINEVDSPKSVDAGSRPSTPVTPVTPSTPSLPSTPINGLSITNGNGVNAIILETPLPTNIANIANIANGTNGTAGANGVNGANGSTNGHCGAATDTESICSTPSSASSSRRGSRQEDTKNRLFGPEIESPRRRVVDRMKSNIFSEQETGGTGTGAGIVRSASVKRYDYVIRRNPITGEVYDEPNAKLNGCNGNGTVHGNSNGVSNLGSASLPTTPVRIRQPPGGKSSGIF